MKKITTLLTALTLSSSAYAMENNTTIKSYIGFDASYTKLIDNETTIDRPCIKMTSSAIPSISAKYGWSDNDRMRIDISYNYLVKPRHIMHKTINFSGATLEYKIHTALVNAYYDIIKGNNINLFLGTGIGVTYFEANLKQNPGITLGIQHGASTTKFKPGLYPAFALYAGISTKITSGIHTEIAYSFKHHAPNKSLQLHNSTNSYIGLKNSISSNNVSLGLRFDI